MIIRWEKAHYYLGKHYNKILDSEKLKPLGREAQILYVWRDLIWITTDLLICSLSGEASKLVIDNYLRSLAHGNKYVFQSLPKVLTLWLEHASTVEQPFDPKRVDNEWVVYTLLSMFQLLSANLFKGVPSTYFESAEEEPWWHALTIKEIYQ